MSKTTSNPVEHPSQLSVGDKLSLCVTYGEEDSYKIRVETLVTSIVSRQDEGRYVVGFETPKNLYCLLDDGASIELYLIYDKGWVARSWCDDRAGQQSRDHEVEVGYV